jgi:hypothetical protein
MHDKTASFQAGSLYRVKTSFQSVRFEFTAGQILRYRGKKYNRYDSATIHTFDRVPEGGSLQWWLSDHDDPSKWKELFETTK